MTAIAIQSSGKAALRDTPVVSNKNFREFVINDILNDGRISSFFGIPFSAQTVRLYIVLAHDREGKLYLLSTDVADSYHSLTPDCTQACLFEREIAEQWGINPKGHPWLKPVRFHAPSGHNGSSDSPSIMDFFQVAGHEVHEVAVGPVHAGIIEPGHFRFQCHGENVFHLEIALGYQHRGVEQALIGGPDKRTIVRMETLAGDSTIGHSLAYSQLLEVLCGTKVSFEAEAIRGIALELERIANHIGDLGALANDIAYLPTASYCGRIRGDFLNLTALICGNRFGRSLVRPGGTGWNIDNSMEEQILAKLDNLSKDAASAVSLLWDTPSVVDRFEAAGIIDKNTGCEIGLVGPAARASGIERDVRFDFPTGIYRITQIPVSIIAWGDVFSRSYVRWLEIQRSMEFIKKRMHAGVENEVHFSFLDIPADTIAVSMVEGWRGEICHTAVTDSNGKFSGYKVVDPSFHNWMGLAMAMRGEQISNFPLCNKSFNLSYCGHDL